MALILHIDCATDYASVCIADNESLIAFEDNYQQKEHASFVQLAIKKMLHEAKLSIKDLDAVAVTSGPGSYTGLRVAMASAKGLCYALNIPLIAVNTLKVMAASAIESYSSKGTMDKFLFCPLLDARRMEVFTAVYDYNLTPLIAPTPMIIDQNPFEKLLKDDKIVFFGSGSEKCRSALKSSHSIFENIQHSARHLIGFAAISFHCSDFANLAYTEPQYLKDFHTIAAI